MKIQSGRCTKCGELNWRSAKAARNLPDQGIRANQAFILWPRPDTVYAALETPTGYAPGINFCLACAPQPGETVLDGFGPVLHLESARSRYAAWFTENWGSVRRLWLKDALNLESAQVDAIMAQWSLDRA